MLPSAIEFLIETISRLNRIKIEIVKVKNNKGAQIKYFVLKNGSKVKRHTKVEMPMVSNGLYKEPGIGLILLTIKYDPITKIEYDNNVVIAAASLPMIGINKIFKTMFSAAAMTSK